MNNAAPRLRTGEYMSFPIIKKLGKTPKELYIKLLYDTILQETTITKDQLKSRDRHASICDARAIFFHMTKIKYPNFGLAQLGSELNRNHATVLHSIERVNRYLKVDPVFKKTYYDIHSSLVTRLEYGI